MHVRLAQSPTSDGRIHARIAISPEHEARYSIYVYGRRAGRDLLLFKGNLKSLGRE